MVEYIQLCIVPTLKDITRYELIQKCKPESYLLLKQKPEISDKILKILDKFLEEITNSCD